MKFELTLSGFDAEQYGDTLTLDLDALDQDTDCDTLIAWEEEADFTLHMVKEYSALRPARWGKTVVWFALKQAGSDVAFADLKLRGVGGMKLIRTDRADAGPPDRTSSEDASKPASSASTRGSRRTTSSPRGKSAS